MKAVIVTPNTIELRPITDLAKTLGGYLEALPVGEDFLCLIDEDGKAKNLPFNPLATNIIQAMLAKRGRSLLPDDWIVGHAIFVSVDEDGNEGDLHESVIREFFPELAN